MMTSLRSWLELAHTSGINPRVAWERWSHLPDITALLALPRRQKGVVHSLEAEYRLVSEWLARDTRHHVLTWADDAYPALWRTLADPPPVVYVWGHLTTLAMQSIAVVGSRRATGEGLGLAREWSVALARAGLCVVSGLALGIDGEAHRATLDVSGATIAFLGGGLMRVHPRAHLALAQRIAAHGGAVASEFPLALSPSPGHFPRRNRLISGLSRGVLVVEAAERSGSLVTAHLAAEQGRDVFVIPGSVRSGQSSGCHRLIREGATLVSSPLDILSEWDMLPVSGVESVKKNTEDALDTHNWLMEEQILYSLMGSEAQSMAVLGGRLGWPEQKMIKFLLTLELKGVINRTFTGYQKVER